MKVLFLGVFKDGTGWSNMATNYILALDKAGITVVPRVIRLSYNPSKEVHPRILELEDNDERGCDVVIQNILPHMMDYNGNFKCIGTYCSETSNFKNTNWSTYLNTMDELWIPNHQMIDAAIESDVKTHMEVVPIPTDVSKYAQRYEKFEIPEIEDRFVFYTVGELNRRKNLTALLRAFHMEFSPDEPVVLMVKCGVLNQSPEDAGSHAQQIIATTKRELNLYPKTSLYSEEIIITEHLSETDMMRLHRTGDCFVSTSFGEAWCLPAFDAMGMGNTPICTDVGGVREFINNECGWLIPGKPTPCFGMSMNAIPGLYSGSSDWIDIDIGLLRLAMRTAFENKEVRNIKAGNGIDNVYSFGYDTVGNQMRELLECQI